MITFLLLDLDDTILDFHKAEKIAMCRMLEEYGVEPTDALLERYHQINQWNWEQLEKGLFTREQVLTGRFRQLFRELSLDVPAEAAAKTYEKNLSQGHYFLPGAKEALDELRGSYRLFLVSNGTAAVQHGRLTSAKLYPYFEKVFISQELGANKPDRAFFDACFAQIPGFDPAKTLVVGDSLTSDIQGGINAGVRTVWVNPAGRGAFGPCPDFRIRSLADLPKLLKTL